jgi:methyltransferase (TIGR00027 family)
VIEGQPSRTAQRVALQRAAHQVLDRPPLILNDPLAMRVISARAARDLQTSPGSEVRGTSRVFLRAVVVARSRLAEDELARAVHEDGVTQYVVLGAGLDTFAYRNPHASVRVFEVDHPDTQRLKRRRLQEAGILIPDSMRFVSCDFATERWLDALTSAGFDPQRAAVFAWLGVIMYLPRDAALGTLRDIGTLPAGTSVVFDYLVPSDMLPWLVRLYYRRRIRMLKSMGEPWTTFFRPEEIARDLREARFDEIQDLSGAAINARFYTGRTDRLRVSKAGHVAIARVRRR